MKTNKVQQILISVIEDNKHIRLAWELAVTEAPGFKMAGLWSNCKEALHSDLSGIADILVLELRPPGVSIVEDVQLFKKKYPEQLLIISTNDEEDENLLGTICAGAVGILSKKSGYTEMLQELLNIFNGGSTINPFIARRILTILSEAVKNQNEKSNSLSEFEYNILQAFAWGKSAKIIARELNVSSREVMLFIRAIYQKLYHYKQGVETKDNFLKKKHLLTKRSNYEN